MLTHESDLLLAVFGQNFVSTYEFCNEWVPYYSLSLEINSMYSCRQFWAALWTQEVLAKTRVQVVNDSGD